MTDVLRTIGKHSYALPVQVGHTRKYKHQSCPASGGQADHKERLYITLKTPYKALWMCHHCGEKGKLKGLMRSPSGEHVSEPVTKAPPPSIPQDSSGVLPQCALDWLGRWEIGQGKARSMGIVWSEHCQSLSIPIQEWSTGAPLGHISRLWAQNANTRYLSRLKPERGLAGIKKASEAVFIVEDWISCVRIAELGYSCVCLMGTSINKHGYWELISSDHTRFVVWLDNDSQLVREKARAMLSYLKALGREASLCIEAQEAKRLCATELATRCSQLANSNS